MMDCDFALSCRHLCDFLSKRTCGSLWLNWKNCVLDVGCVY